MSERWHGWADRIDDPALPPAIAARVVRHGSLEERHALVKNSGLAHDVLLALIEHGESEIVRGLWLIYELPVDLLELLAQRHGLTDEQVAGHPNASLSRKYALPAAELTGASLTRFFEAVRASATEEAHGHEAIDQDPAITLGEVWQRARPHAG